MAIEDLVGNALLPATVGDMLGFEEVTPAEVLPLKAIDFVTQVMRDADAAEGNLFLERFFKGFQSVWEITQGNIFAIKNLSSVTDIPDEFLPFLKNLVGWTSEPVTRRITDGMDAATLRRLISASVALWRGRGPEDAIVDFLNLLVGQRIRIWNWFDLRWILDEAAIGETHQGRDPFLLDLPQDGDDQQRFNVRIVDPGDLDRELVRNVVKLMRPVGERIDISYIDFLDQFTIDDDDFQWQALTGSLPVVEGGLAKPPSGSENEIATDVEGADLWAEYVAFWRARTSDGVIRTLFYVVDVDNWYEIRVDPTLNSLTLLRKVATVETTLATLDFGLQGILVFDKFYGIRVHTAREGATNRIKVYLDGDLVFNETDASHSQGSVGFANFTGETVEVDEVELFQVPLESDEIGLNS